jgi:hypothetical protein
VTPDHVISPAAAGHAEPTQAHIVKVDALHLSTISHPAAVTRLVVAARNTSLKSQPVVMVAETGKEPNG